MKELITASAALTSLIALTYWARAVPTRAWGEATPRAPARAFAVALSTIALQTVASMVAAGPAAGLAVVAASWMVLGWLLVLAMNQWPQASLRWAWALGLAGGCSCVLAIAWAALEWAHALGGAG